MIYPFKFQQFGKNYKLNIKTWLLLSKIHIFIINLGDNYEL